MSGTNLLIVTAVVAMVCPTNLRRVIGLGGVILAERFMW